MSVDQFGFLYWLSVQLDALLGPLSDICNKSFTQGVFPDNMKVGKVIPFYKAGDRIGSRHLLCAVSDVRYQVYVTAFQVIFDGPREVYYAVFNSVACGPMHGTQHGTSTSTSPFTSLHFTSLPFVRGEVLFATCHLLI